MTDEYEGRLAALEDGLLTTRTLIVEEMATVSKRFDAANLLLTALRENQSDHWLVLTGQAASLRQIDQRIIGLGGKLTMVEDRVETVADDVAALTVKVDTMDRKFESRFDAVDQRFDAMDQRLDAMDRRLDAMDRRFDGIDQRLDAIDRRFDVMDGKLDLLVSLLKKPEGDPERN